MPPTWVSTSLDALVAIGTLAVAIAAIWGDWLRAKLVPPRLRIEIVNPAGQLTVFGVEEPVAYYHLRVVNLRRWMTVQDCRLMLVAVSRRGPDHQFRPEPMPVPFQLVWAPQGITPALSTIHDKQTADLGWLVAPKPGAGQSAKFIPALYAYPNDFRGFVGPGEAVRYSLQLIASGLASERYEVIEVSWDGRWTTNPEERAKSLVVRQVAA